MVSDCLTSVLIEDIRGKPFAVLEQLESLRGRLKNEEFSALKVRNDWIPRIKYVLI